jgi:uncharacterized protein with HEPN domain
MTQRDRQVPLRHMLQYAREALAMAGGRTRTDLSSDRMFQLALVRLLEVIGEAATRVPDSVRAAHPNIPWPEIVGLRNRLIHGYDAVDLDIVWSIVVTDLPALAEQLAPIIADEGGEQRS